VLWITPEASKLLGYALEGYRAGDPRWRENIMPVIARIIANKLDNTAFYEPASRSLFASFVGEAGAGEYLIRLQDNNTASDDEILRKRFDLTGREAEVLRWIVQGKSNRDVAAILACSPRTVNKHLEQIYHKLEVENRTAAAMLAMRVLSRP
jgi:DNA-binding CsgD family transcriptional regulator